MFRFLAIFVLFASTLGLAYNLQTNKSNSALSARANTIRSSLSFDGSNDYARFTNLPLTTVFTYELWVKRTVDSNTYQTILSDADTTYSRAMVTLFVDGGSSDCSGAPDQFAYYQHGNNSLLCSGVSAGLNVWHHLAVTRDSLNTIRIFVDGIGSVTATQNSSPKPLDSTGILAIGKAGSYSGEYFGGLVDGVRISNIPRYTTNFTPATNFTSDANTLALWHFNETSGQTLSDSSTNARHGTLGSSSSTETVDPTWSTDSPVTETPPPPPPTTTYGCSSSGTCVQVANGQYTEPTCGNTCTPPPTTTNRSIRFYGNGVNDIDRIKIPVEPQTKADIGSTNFTIEWWMKASLNDNNGSVTCGANDNWIYGNIIFDRDIWDDDVGDGNHNGDFGISLGNGRIAFATTAWNGSGYNSYTLCSSTSVTNNAWHHVAVTREVADGKMAIFIDGIKSGEVATGPTGDLSYRNGRVADHTDDPFLVIGAEKHDVSATAYPSYNGHLDEVRISNNIRYTQNFPRPQSEFSNDANTILLYHFNESSGTTIIDSSTNFGGQLNSTLRVGGNPSGPIRVLDSPFSGSPAPVMPPPPPVTGQKNMYWGAVVDARTTTGNQVTVNPPWDMSSITDYFEIDAGKRMSIAAIGTAWQRCENGCGYKDFAYLRGNFGVGNGCRANYDYPTADGTNRKCGTVDRLRSNGYIPFLTWAPRDELDGHTATYQPNFTLRSIYQGTHDDYIRRFAQQVRDWGHPLFLRPMWEANGSWYSWSEQKNDNANGDYVLAWRHIWNIFDEVGTQNVSWVWNMNTEYNGSANMSALYPGDKYVDWVAIDSYNWGNIQNRNEWRTFDQATWNTYAKIRNIAPSKPVMLAEISSSETVPPSTPGDVSKSDWIRSFMSDLQLSKYDALGAFLWFNWSNSDGDGADWVIESSTESQEAFASSISNSMFRSNDFTTLNSPNNQTPYLGNRVNPIPHLSPFGPPPPLP